MVQTSLLQASVDQPARKNATTDVISRTVFYTPHIYCDTSPFLMDPALLVGSGVCGRAEYCAFACLTITKEQDK